MKRIIWLALCLLLLTGCGEIKKPGAEGETAAETTTEGTGEEEGDIQKEPLFREMAEDEVFLLYGENGAYAEWYGNNCLTFYDRMGTVIKRFENASYEGRPGVYKRSELFVIGLDGIADGEEESQRYGIYSLEEDRFVLEPDYFRITEKPEQPGVYLCGRYNRQNEAESFYYADGELKPGDDCMAAGEFLWVPHWEEEKAEIFRGSELVKTLTGIGTAGSPIGDKIAGYQYEGDRMDPVIWNADGSQLFSLERWKKERGILPETEVYRSDCSIQMERMVIAGENQLWLCDFSGRVLREYDMEENGIEFLYDFPAYKVTGGNRRPEQGTFYNSADQEMQTAAGIPYTVYLGGSCFGYYQDGNLILEDVENGKTLVLEDVREGSDYVYVIGGLTQLYREGEDGCELYNWDGLICKEEFIDVTEKEGRCMALTYRESDNAFWGYGTGYGADQEGTIFYRSPLREYLIWAEERFAVVRRGNYLCAVDSQGKILVRQLDPAMGDD